MNVRVEVSVNRVVKIQNVWNMAEALYVFKTRYNGHVKSVIAELFVAIKDKKINFEHAILKLT